MGGANNWKIITTTKHMFMIQYLIYAVLKFWSVSNLVTVWNEIGEEVYWEQLFVLTVKCKDSKIGVQIYWLSHIWVLLSFGSLFFLWWFFWECCISYGWWIHSYFITRKLVSQEVNYMVLGCSGNNLLYNKYLVIKIKVIHGKSTISILGDSGLKKQLELVGQDY